MSDEVKVLAIPKDAVINPEGVKALRQRGVILVRTEQCDAVRLLRPATDVEVLPANEFVWAALKALADGSSYSGEQEMRHRFVKNLVGRLDKKVNPEPQP